MAYLFPENAIFQFSKTFEAEVAVTNLSNDYPTIVSATAHGYVDGDEILMSCGWEDVDSTVYRIARRANDSFWLLGLNSKSINFYPPGTSAAGTARKVVSWVTVPGVLTIGTTGGGARYAQISPLSGRNGTNVPTGFNQATLTLTISHDPSDPAFELMQDIARTHTKVAFKMLLAGGATTYGFGYLSVAEAPSLVSGQPNTVTAVYTILGSSMSYKNGIDDEDIHPGANLELESGDLALLEAGDAILL